MQPRQILFAAALGLAAVVVFLFVLWSPARQIRLHQENFLSALAKKNWKDAEPFIADDYSDRWGHDKAFMIEGAQQVFSQFVFLKMQLREPVVTTSKESGTISTHIEITGRGSPVADVVMETVSNLREPFTFRWQQRSWKPWDWELVRMDHPQLTIPEY